MYIEHNYDYEVQKYSPLVYGDIPDVKPGTIRYDDFWDQQDDYMLNGYKPEGLPRITKQLYYYLNATKIYMLPRGEKHKRYHYPDFRTLDRRLFNEVEYAEMGGYGIIVGKPRQVGLSWVGSAIVEYEMTFIKDTTVGVAGGQDNYVQDFKDKVKQLNKHKRIEYKHSIAYDNDDVLQYGYKWSRNKQTLLDGIGTKMYAQTMHDSPGKFEGKNFSKVIFEEAGQFKNIIASLRATEPAFKTGSIMYGIPIIYGTGGEMDKGSKGYKKLWDSSSYTDPKSTPYMLKKVFISATDFFPGTAVDESGDIVHFFDYKTGETNKKLALDFILKMYERTRKDAEGHIKVMQSYPLKPSHIFQKSQGGVLDRIRLNLILSKITDGDIPVEVKTGFLDWVDTDETKRLLLRARDTKEKTRIRILKGSTVKFVQDEINGNYIKVLDPINKDGMQYKPDVGGIDSYDDEVEFNENKHSYGAAVTYRTYYGEGHLQDLPTGLLIERGDASNDDTFFENSVKMAVFNNVEMNIEYTKKLILNYFQDVGAHAYLKKQPILIDYESTSGNQYGTKMPAKMKNIVTKLLKLEVAQNYEKYFIEALVLDLIDYGERNTDASMALGMCLITKLERFQEISSDLDDEYISNPIDTMSYTYVDDNGDVQVSYYGESPENQIEVFNPERDLNNEELKIYKAEREREKTERSDAEQRVADLKEKYGNDLDWMMMNDIEIIRNGGV